MRDGFLAEIVLLHLMEDSQTALGESQDVIFSDFYILNKEVESICLLDAVISKPY